MLNFETEMSKKKPASYVESDNKRFFWTVFILLCFLLLTGSLTLPLLAGPDEPAGVIHAAASIRGQFIGKEIADPALNKSVNLSPLTQVVLPSFYGEVVSYANCFAFNTDNSASCAKFYGHLSGGDVIVETYQGRYPPLYYTLVGIPTLVFNGELSLYFMRFASDIISAFLIALAIYSALQLKNRLMSLIAVMLSLTPVFLMVNMVVGATALEDSAALCFWISSIYLFTADEPINNKLIHVTGLSLTLFLLARPDSPFWAFWSTVVIFAAFFTRQRFRLLLKQKSSQRWSILIIAAGLITAFWDFKFHALNVVGYHYNGPFPWGKIFTYAFSQSWVYMAQMLGYHETTRPWIPTLLDAIAIIGFCFVCLVGVRKRLWFVLLIYAVGIWIIPVLVQSLSYPDDGFIWQGRYCLPFAVGLPITAANGFDLENLHGILLRLFKKLTSIGFVSDFLYLLVATLGYEFILEIYIYAEGFNAHFNLFKLFDAKWQSPISNFVAISLIITTLGLIAYTVRNYAFGVPKGRFNFFAPKANSD
jgi:hypothetical protein